jgi:hypothetical protein
MMNRILQNHWCRFVAGNLSVALLVVGIPTVILLSMTGQIRSATAGLGILAMVHASLVGLQISKQGSWIPEKWLAAAFVVLPVVDVQQTVRLFSKGLWLEGFWAFVLALFAAAITVAIVKHQWRKWHAPKDTVLIVPGSGEDHHAHHHHTEDPTTMVY